MVQTAFTSDSSTEILAYTLNTMGVFDGDAEALATELNQFEDGTTYDEESGLWFCDSSEARAELSNSSDSAMMEQLAEMASMDDDELVAYVENILAA